MFSREARLKAVKLYIQYDLSYAGVVRELGYPSESRMLKPWYKEYQSSGTLHESFRSNNCCKYSKKQKTAAVNYYFTPGRNATRACRKLGYPSRPMLCQ